MADQTIVDQFLFKFGLDASDFKEGAREVKAENDKLTLIIQQNARSSGRELEALASKWLKWALVIKGLKKGDDYLVNLSRDVRQLGIDSRNLGIAADELKNFQNVSEMMGGTARELTDSIAGLQKAVFDLAFNGQLSDSLQMLARLGVEFQDAAGNARDFESVVLDAQSKIQEQMKQGMTYENANNLLRQAGFDSGMSQAMLAGNVQDQLAQQRARRQVNAEHLGSATRWEQSATNRDQTIAAGALGALPARAAAGVVANDAISKAVGLVSGQEGWDQFLKDLGGVWDETGGVLNTAGEKLSQAGDSLMRGAKSWLQSRGERNNNPGNIRAVGDQRRDDDGFRIFDTLDEGILAANKQLDKYAARGIDTIDEIVNTWAAERHAPGSGSESLWNRKKENYKGFLESEVGVSRDRQLTNADRALLMAGMFRFEGWRGGPNSGAVADVLQNAPGAGIGGNTQTTNITVGEVNISTQATDANGIADGIRGALTRKTLAGHAERGQR